MTVAEFIEWLKTQDQTAVVECVKHDRAGSYYEQGGTASVVSFETKLSSYCNLGGEPTLLIGESD